MKGNQRPRRLRVQGCDTPLVSSAGGALLIEAARVSGLAGALSTVLGRWRRSRARHDPGKVLLDLAIALGLGGDCLADVSVLRAQPALFGPVASDPTVSRLVDTLAADAPATLAAIRSARADARARVWAHRRPVEGSIVVDLDATIVISHSEKEQAAPTFKGTFGFHPLLAFLDHGPDGAGEPLAAVLRRGSASANTAADLIAVLDLALRQLPERDRRRVLVRADSGGGTKTFLRHVSATTTNHKTSKITKDRG